MAIVRFERNKRLKIMITFGMIAPSAARLFFPEIHEIQNVANMVMLVTGLMWLWEM